MLAISNSCSSSSTSLFSSGLSSSSSHTDFSPPQSPTLDPRKPIEYPRQGTISNICEAPLFICEATPRQSSWKRTLDLSDVSHDVGYESDRESRDMPVYSTKKPARKGGFQPGSRLAHSALPREFDPCINTSSVCPLKPQLLPIIGLDSPSPILLPGPAHPSDFNVYLPQRDNKKMSPSKIFETPGLTCPNSPSRQGNVICVNMAVRNSEAIDMPNFCVSPTISRSKKAASGIGLGLPSVLCRPHPFKEANERPVSIDAPSLRQESIKRSDSCAQESFSLPLAGLGIITGARRFLRTHRYPKRHLYDIPEHVSPKFKCKTVPMGESHSSTSTAGLSPVARDLSKLKRLHSPLLNACKKPLQWFSSRSSLMEPRTSPVIVHDDVQQIMNCAPHNSVGSSKAAVLF